MDIKLGQYKIDLGQSAYADYIVSARFSTALDSQSQLSLVVCEPQSMAKKIGVGEYPKDANVSWRDRLLFKGELFGVSHERDHRVVLTFRDKFFLASRASLNISEKKKTRLSDCLSKLARELGLGCQFVGDYSDLLPSMSFSGRSVFENLKVLANNYGFHFVYRSAKQQLVFIRLNSWVEEVEIKDSDAIAHPSDTRSVGSTFSEVNLRYSQPSTASTVDRTIKQSELYGAASKWQQHSTYQEKLSLAQSKAGFSFHTTDAYLYENGGALVALRFSKKLMEQEEQQFVLYEPKALPGDRVVIKKWPVPNIQDGAYLVRSCAFTLAGALPTLQMNCIRP